jgi:hypothetical protein
MTLGIAAAAALALAGCAAQSDSIYSGRVMTPAPHAEVAAQDAQSLLAAFQPPAGAVRLTSAPGAVPELGGQPAQVPVSPDLVVRTAWWTVPEKPAALLSWITAHPPTGTTAGGSANSSTAGGSTLWELDFNASTVPDVIDQRSLTAEVVALPSGGSALRVDSFASYLPTRSAAETIPAAATLDVTPVGPKSQNGVTATSGAPMTVTDQAQIAKISALINNLPTMPAGPLPCPADFGGELRLVFRDAADTQLVSVDADASGCGAVSVTAGGTDQPALGGGPVLIGQIAAILGAHWNLTQNPLIATNQAP